MKLKILKHVLLAQPETWKPHLAFHKGELLETDNEYVIDNLLKSNAAKIIDKKMNEKSCDVENDQDKKTKKQKVPKNKMHVCTNNKEI